VFTFAHFHYAMFLASFLARFSEDDALSRANFPSAYPFENVPNNVWINMSTLNQLTRKMLIHGHPRTLILPSSNMLIWTAIFL